MKDVQVQNIICLFIDSNVCLALFLFSSSASDQTQVTNTAISRASMTKKVRGCHESLFQKIALPVGVTAGSLVLPGMVVLVPGYPHLLSRCPLELTVTTEETGNTSLVTLSVSNNYQIPKNIKLHTTRSNQPTNQPTPDIYLFASLIRIPLY